MAEPTRFTALEAMEGITTDKINVGAMVSKVLTITKAVDYALVSTEKKNRLIKTTMSAASKTLTLGLPEGQEIIVKNAGATNAFTVKNIATDTGTSLAAGKSLLIFASTTADASTVIALD